MKTVSIIQIFLYLFAGIMFIFATLVAINIINIGAVFAFIGYFITGLIISFIMLYKTLEIKKEIGVSPEKAFETFSNWLSKQGMKGAIDVKNFDEVMNTETKEKGFLFEVSVSGKIMQGIVDCSTGMIKRVTPKFAPSVLATAKSSWDSSRLKPQILMQPKKGLFQR